MKILALDPGGTTGWAVYHEEAVPPSNVSPGKYEPWKHQCGQIGPGDHHEELFSLMEAVDPSIVVCEMFEYRQRSAGSIRMKIDLVSREYIGVVKLYRDASGCELVMQPSSICNGPRLVTDEFIKALGLWKASQRHAMDAREHLIHYMVTKMNRKDLVPKL